MNDTDICFYMSITKEENSSLLIAESANANIPDEDLTLTGQLTRRLSFRRTSFNMGKTSLISETKPLNNKSLLIIEKILNRINNKELNFLDNYSRNLTANCIPREVRLNIENNTFDNNSANKVEVASKVSDNTDSEEDSE